MVVLNSRQLFRVLVDISSVDELAVLFIVLVKLHKLHGHHELYFSRLKCAVFRQDESLRDLHKTAHPQPNIKSVVSSSFVLKI